MITTPADWDNRRDEVLRELGRQTAIVMRDWRSLIDAFMIIDQRSQLLNPWIFKMHAFGRDADLLALFCQWYGIDENRRLTLPVLFLIVAHEQGMAYLGSQAQLNSSPNQDASIAAVSETTNKALGILLRKH